MAQNRLAAILMGIKVKRVSTVTWAIASMIGGVAGILFAPDYLCGYEYGSSRHQGLYRMHHRWFWLYTRDAS